MAPARAVTSPSLITSRGTLQLLLDAQEHVLDLAEALGRDAAEEGGHHGAVVDVDAGRAAADGIHPGQFGGGRLEGGHDLAVVILGVGVLARLPDDLFAEDRLAIHHRADLAVGCAQVEADPAAVQVAAEGFAGLAGRRHFRRIAGDDREGLLVDLLAHEEVVELALALG